MNFGPIGWHSSALDKLHKKMHDKVLDKIHDKHDIEDTLATIRLQRGCAQIRYKKKLVFLQKNPV